MFPCIAASFYDSFHLILQKCQNLHHSYFLFLQYETYGRLTDSMLVNTILMLVYVTKFFWWEAGYWNTMDIAHDRGLFCIRLFAFSLLASCSPNCHCGFVVNHASDEFSSVYFSWLLHMLGMLGLGPICVYISWHVPCQSSCRSGNSGSLNTPPIKSAKASKKITFLLW